MQLGEVRLVQHGAAQACYQPITGPAWQRWGLGEEGRKKRDSSLSLHMLSVALVKEVWCSWNVCVCVYICREREWSGGVGGWVFDSIPPPSSSGESHVVCTVFLHHMTCRFFFLFKHFSSSFAPSLPPLAMWALLLPGRKGKTAVAVPSSSPLTKELCKQEIQIRCRWVEEPGSNQIPLPSPEKRNLTGASRLQGRVRL